MKDMSRSYRSEKQGVDLAVSIANIHKILTDVKQAGITLQHYTSVRNYNRAGEEGSVQKGTAARPDTLRPVPGTLMVGREPTHKLPSDLYTYIVMHMNLCMCAHINTNRLLFRMTEPNLC